MFKRLKKGDLFFYKSDIHIGDWMICEVIKVIGLYNESDIRYSKYHVIKTSGMESVDSISSFGLGCDFHAQCTKIKSLSDSDVLAAIL